MYFLLPMYLYDTLVANRFSKGWKMAIILLTCLFLTGALFKSMSWLGANVMLTLSLGSLAVVYAVLTFKQKKATATYYFQNAFTVFGSIGILFRILHLPGANVIFVSAMAICIVWLMAYTWHLRSGKIK